MYECNGICRLEYPYRKSISTRIKMDTSNIRPTRKVKKLNMREISEHSHARFRLVNTYDSRAVYLVSLFCPCGSPSHINISIRHLQLAPSIRTGVDIGDTDTDAAIDSSSTLLTEASWAFHKTKATASPNAVARYYARRSAWICTPLLAAASELGGSGTQVRQVFAFGGCKVRKLCR